MRRRWEKLRTAVAGNLPDEVAERRLDEFLAQLRDLHGGAFERGSESLGLLTGHSTLIDQVRLVADNDQGDVCVFRHQDSLAEAGQIIERGEGTDREDQHEAVAVLYPLEWRR